MEDLSSNTTWMRLAPGIEICSIGQNCQNNKTYKYGISIASKINAFDDAGTFNIPKDRGDAQLHAGAPLLHVNIRHVAKLNGQGLITLH